MIEYLRSAERLNGRRSPRVAAALSGLGEGALMSAQLRDAERYLLRAQKIYENLGLANSRGGTAVPELLAAVRASLKANLGVVLRRLGRIGGDVWT